MSRTDFCGAVSPDKSYFCVRPEGHDGDHGWDDSEKLDARLTNGIMAIDNEVVRDIVAAAAFLFHPSIPEELQREMNDLDPGSLARIRELVEIREQIRTR